MTKEEERIKNISDLLTPIKPSRGSFKSEEGRPKISGVYNDLLNRRGFFVDEIKALDNLKYIIPEDYYQSLYKEIGGLKGLFEARRKAGLQTELNEDDYKAMGYDVDYPFIRNMEDAVTSNHNVPVGVNLHSTDNPDIGGVYHPSTHTLDLSNTIVISSDGRQKKDGSYVLKKMYAPTGGDRYNSIFTHELTHALQYGADEEERTKRDDKSWEASVRAAKQILREQPGISNDDLNTAIYFKRLTEVQAFVNQAVMSYMDTYGTIPTTKEDFEHIYKHSKNLLEHVGIPKEHFMKIAPTLATNDKNENKQYT